MVLSQPTLDFQFCDKPFTILDSQYVAPNSPPFLSPGAPGVSLIAVSEGQLSQSLLWLEAFHPVSW